MQVLCPYYVKKKTHESNVCIDRCVVASLKFELNESIIKTIDKAFISYIFYCFKSKCGCPISSKITKLYFILNIIQLPRG